MSAKYRLSDYIWPKLTHVAEVCGNVFFIPIPFPISNGLFPFPFPISNGLFPFPFTLTGLI